MRASGRLVFFIWFEGIKCRFLPQFLENAVKRTSVQLIGSTATHTEHDDDDDDDADDDEDAEVDNYVEDDVEDGEDDDYEDDDMLLLP